jgi:hypothetical protein
MLSPSPKAKQVPTQMRYNLLLPPRTLIRDKSSRAARDSVTLHPHPGGKYGNSFENYSARR